MNGVVNRWDLCVAAGREVGQDNEIIDEKMRTELWNFRHVRAFSKSVD